MRYLLCCLILCGCIHNPNIVETSVDNAKENINTLIALKPECTDVGDACKRELDNVERICNQTIEKTKEDSWKRGFKSGISLTALCLIMLFILLKRVKL